MRSGRKGATTSRLALDEEPLWRLVEAKRVADNVVAPRSYACAQSGYFPGMYLLAPVDIFALGIGFDIAGGYLVARGLLISPHQILRRSLNEEHYFVPAETASLIGDRVDAQLGLISLLSGFSIQAVGYALSAAQTTGIIASESSLARATVALGAAAIGAASTIGAWRTLRWPLARRTIVSVSRDPLALDGEYKLTEVPRAPSAKRLMRLGAEFGREKSVDEDVAEYARRVYGLEDISEDDFLATAFHPARLA